MYSTTGDIEENKATQGLSLNANNSGPFTFKLQL